MIYNSIMNDTRTTKYVTEVKKTLAANGHASNALLLKKLQETYPELSATTVHRITARLSERGEIGIAPNLPNGAVRYDANTRPHDHFVCDLCGRLKDIDIADDLIPKILPYLEGCEISGRLVISGNCNKCVLHTGGEHNE